MPVADVQKLVMHPQGKRSNARNELAVCSSAVANHL